MAGRARSRPAPQPEERRSTEWAHDVIRGRILRGEIEPGTALAQAALAEELGISRTPLREAMRLLQNEGLLEGEPNRRLRVAGVSPEELEQLYAMRIANECFALGVGTPLMDDERIAAIGSSLQMMEGAMLAADQASADSHHREFHRLLVAEAGGRFLQLSDTLWDHTARYRAAYVAAAGDMMAVAFEAQADHARIFAAVERRDGKAASAALAAHYARTARALIAASDPGSGMELLSAAVDGAGADIGLD